jgi:ribose transport system ATP-binding protein
VSTDVYKAAAWLQVRGLSKTFPGTRALANVDLDVRAGEIHALVGGNGSGKSTLIKILTGVHQADPGGSIKVGATTVEPTQTTPEQARELGVHAVHQDLGIFPDLSVLENMAIGYAYETKGSVQVNWRAHRARTKRLIERFEIDATPNTPLNKLSRAAQTQVAIARALQAEDDERSGLLILDEPTASLPAHEVDLLLDLLRRYAAQGQAILYVSHRLDEVLSLADRVTVLRDGHAEGTFPAHELDENALIKLIVGQEIERTFPLMPRVTEAKPMLEVSDLRAGPLRGVSFSLRPKEVLGIAGLLGAGRTELLRALFGDLAIRSGSVRLDDDELRVSRPAEAMARGIALIPEDRTTDGGFHDLPLWANLAMGNTRDYWRAGFIHRRQMKADCRAAMGEFLIKAPSEDALLSTLSGGNQQKVLLARWLRRKPRLLLLDEPTQGVDAGARAEIYGLVRDAVEAGAAAIVVASDLEELAHVSDRVLVLREGRFVAELSSNELTVERLTQAAYESEAS